MMLRGPDAVAGGLSSTDVEVWLNNKLEGSWSSEKISSLLTPPTVESATARFSFLDTAIKLKLLFSFVTLGRKAREDLEEPIRALQAVANADDDEWVAVISKLFSNLMAREKEGENAPPRVMGEVLVDNDHFNNIHDQLKETLAVQSAPIAFYPLEYPYLNERVIGAESAQHDLGNHFTLKHPLEQPTLPATPKRPPKPLPSASTGTPSTLDKKGKRPLSESGSTGFNRKRPAPTSTLARSVDGLGDKKDTRKKLRILDLDEAIQIEEQQKKEKDSKRLEEESEERERKKKERTDAIEHKRIEREERKLKRQEERDQKKKQKEDQRQEKEAKRRDRQRQQQMTKQKRTSPSDEGFPPMSPVPESNAPVRNAIDPKMPHGLYQTLPPRSNISPSGGGVPFSGPPLSRPPLRTESGSSVQASSLLSQALLPNNSFPQYSHPYNNQQAPQAAPPMSGLHQPDMGSWPPYGGAHSPYGAPTQMHSQQAPIPSNHMHMPPGQHMPPQAPFTPHQAVPPSNVPPTLFEQANRLADKDRERLISFLSGHAVQNPNPASPVQQILINEDEKMDPTSGRYLEQIIFEINYLTGSWRKLRRKKPIQ